MERPKQCRELHNQYSTKIPFRCAEISQLDVNHFRQKLYRTDEKRDQNDFLYNFIVPSQCKASLDHSKNNYKGRRMLSIVYQIQKSTGKVVPICNRFFKAVTGFGNSKCKVIFMKRFKNDLLQKGDETMFQPIRPNCDGDLLVAARKEKLFNLQKGQLTSFAQAMTGIDPESIQDKSPDMKSSKKSPKKKRPVKSKHEDEDDNHYEEYLEEVYAEPLEMKADVKPTKAEKRVRLNLEAMDVCRICLSNNKTMLNLFEKPKNEKYKPIDLLEYSLAINIQPFDNLPQCICPNCLESVKIACNVKTEWLKSTKIIEDCLEENEVYAVVEKSACDSFKYLPSKKDSENTIKLQVEVTEQNLEDDNMETTVEEPEEVSYDKSMESFEDGIVMEMDSDEEKMDEGTSDQETTAEETGQQTTKSSESYAGLKPRMCFLCNADFETTAEDHFQYEHPLVNFERCTK